MERQSNYHGVSLLGLVFIVFLTLKLCKVIDWSWWWVTAPLWLPAVLVIAFTFIYGIYKAWKG